MNKIITSYPTYTKYSSGYYHGRYDPLDKFHSLIYGTYTPDRVFRYELWLDKGTMGWDDTEDTSWYDYYNPRHPPYKNIASGEKPYDLIYIYGLVLVIMVILMK